MPHIVARIFRLVLSPLNGTTTLLLERSPAPAPDLIPCFQEEPGTLMGIWHVLNVPSRPHYDEDQNHNHVLATDCPTLVVLESLAQLEVIARPDDDELTDIKKAGYRLVPILPNPLRVKALPGVCNRIAEAVEGQDGVEVVVDKFGSLQRSRSSHNGHKASSEPARLGSASSQQGGSRELIHA